MGAVQGIPVCFDAKECNTDTFPLQNIHEHQVTFMSNFEKQGGIAFLIIYYSTRNELYICVFLKFKNFGNAQKQEAEKVSDMKSFLRHFYPVKNGCLVSYLEALQQDLDLRD